VQIVVYFGSFSPKEKDENNENHVLGKVRDEVMCMDQSDGARGWIKNSKIQKIGCVGHSTI
jgi:hypothetical protein